MNSLVLGRNKSEILGVGFSNQWSKIYNISVLYFILCLFSFFGQDEVDYQRIRIKNGINNEYRLKSLVSAATLNYSNQKSGPDSRLLQGVKDRMRGFQTLFYCKQPIQSLFRTIELPLTPRCRVIPICLLVMPKNIEGVGKYLRQTFFYLKL